MSWIRIKDTVINLEHITAIQRYNFKLYLWMIDGDDNRFVFDDKDGAIYRKLCKAVGVEAEDYSRYEVEL